METLIRVICNSLNLEHDELMTASAAAFMQRAAVVANCPLENIPAPAEACRQLSKRSRGY